MTAEPNIWILSRGRKGDLDQMLVLARAAGWPFEVKRLSFRGPDIPVLSPLLLRRRESGLAPPWPGIVLCAEASASVIALEIKRKAKGRTRAVCIGRPGRPAASIWSSPPRNTAFRRRPTWWKSQCRSLARHSRWRATCRRGR